MGGREGNRRELGGKNVHSPPLPADLAFSSLQQIELEVHTRNQLLARVVLQWRCAAEEKRKREERVRGLWCLLVHTLASILMAP